MSCYKPLEGWKAKERNESGKRSVVFRRSAGDESINIPCGRCIGCQADKAEDWSVRLCHESTLHFRSCFLTLTYSDDCLPRSGRLNKADPQKFLKRVRASGSDIRFFMCGEYGSRTGRPHYHMLVFGEDFREGSVKFGLSGEYYDSEFLRSKWGLGHVMAARLESATAFYTAGYTLKNAGFSDCFHSMSTRPYIGAGWLDKYWSDCARNGFVTIEGVKHPVPDAYLRRPEYAARFVDLKNDREAFMLNLSPEEIWQRRERLRGKEFNHAARAAFGRAQL